MDPTRISPTPPAAPPAGDDPAGSAVVRLRDVSVRRAGRTILGPIDWTIRDGERWVVLGPNGAGKTTLLEVLATTLWPSTGSVEILGERIGRVDARLLRRRIGIAGSAVERAVPGELAAREVVMTAREAALGTWWHAWTDEDRERAVGLLGRLGVGHLADRPFGTLSSGERRRVLVARALMPDPRLLLLDEPAASLDLGGREALLRDLAGLAGDGRLAAVVLVSHHVEEIPPGFGHAAVLRSGRFVAAGSTEESITGGALTEAFGLPIRVDRTGGRFSARLEEA